MNATQSSIQSLNAFQDLEKYLVEVDDTALFIFDFADVLLQAKSSLLHPKNKDIKNRYRFFLKNTFGQEKTEWLWSIIMQHEWRDLVDPHAPETIKRLQTSGAKIMSLSAMRTGPFGVIKSMEAWRASRLRDVAIDFGQTAPTSGSFILSEECRDGFSPVFDTGILCTYIHTKGEALALFLKKIAWMPRRIIFVDDKISYLSSVQEMAESLAIPFIGLHYTASYERSFLSNEQLFDFQIHHLIHYETWLFDDEACLAMQKNTQLLRGSNESSVR